VPDAVSRLPRLDENEFNDEQDLPADDVCDKGFSVSNTASTPLRATFSSLLGLTAAPTPSTPWRRP